MTPEQFQSWSSPTKEPEKASADPIIPYLKGVSQAASAGGKRVAEGFDEFKNAGNNPLQMLEGGLKGASGVASIATSPIAPAMKPVGDAVNYIGDKTSDNKNLQIAMQTPEGQNVAKGAEVVGDIANVAGTVAGGIDAVRGFGALKSDPVASRVPPAEVDTLVRESGKVDPVKAQSLAWKDIQPKETPTTKLAYAKGKNTTPQGMITSGKLTPSPADTKLIADYSKLYEDGTIKDSMNPQQKQDAVAQRAAQLNNQQKGFLADNDKAVTLSDSKGKIGLFDILDSTAKKSSMPFSKDPTTKGAYDSVIEMYKSLLDTGKSAGTVKGASTLTKLDSALSALDEEMSKFKAWGKTATGDITESGLARQQAIRDIHTTVRDYIASQLPKNSPWKSIRLEESNMYQTGDRLAQRAAETVGTSKVGAAMKRNPVIKAGVNAAASVPIIGAGIKMIP